MKARSRNALQTAIAFLTDPWGTYIQLTENLARGSQPLNRFIGGRG